MSQKNFKRLIWCKSKTTVFTEPVFIFSKSSYSNLNFGIKQSKNSVESSPSNGYQKLKFRNRPDFFEKCTKLRQPYCFSNVHWSITIL